MRCDGCQADLEKANHLPLEMTRGVLIIVCPLCKYESLGKTADGRVYLLNKSQETG